MLTLLSVKHPQDLPLANLKINEIYVKTFLHLETKALYYFAFMFQLKFVKSLREFFIKIQNKSFQ